VISVQATDAPAACLICGGPVAETRVPYINRDHVLTSPGHDPFASVANCFCSSCGFGWTYPPVPANELDDFYRTAYWAATANDPIRRPFRQTFAPTDARSLAQLLLVRMHSQLTGALLDIGPGPRGVSFRTLGGLAPSMRRFAFEPDVAAADVLARNLDVRVIGGRFPSAVDLAAIGEPDGFQVILMSHVLEHFNGDDVIPTLAAAGRLLKQGGVLMCEVPLVDLRQHADQRRNDSPHLSFFSESSLRLALEQADFEPLFIATCGTPYDSWWASVTQQTSGSTARSRLRRTLKNAARIAPVGLPASLSSRLYAVMAPHSAFNVLRSDLFDYGGNRTTLRALARRT
jgi:SAM-dependent methyltransferase